MSPKLKITLSWNKKNIENILLLNEYKQLGKKDTNRRPKNNQFNIRWNLGRFFKHYYNVPISLLNRIESRLDILLFRSNLFLSKSHILSSFNKGLILVNNRKPSTPYLFLKPGDIIQIKDPVEKVWTSKLKNTSKLTINNWKEKYKNSLIQNVNYLEINNNIKTIFLLNPPLYHNIPFPFNLHRYY